MNIDLVIHGLKENRSMTNIDLVIGSSPFDSGVCIPSNKNGTPHLQKDCLSLTCINFNKEEILLRYMVLKYKS